MSTYGTIITFLPLLAARRRLGEAGLFYLLFALTLVLLRSLGGRLSDRLGRSAVIIPGLVLMSAGMGLLAVAWTRPLLLGAGVVYAAGYALAQPALLALAADRTGHAERGAAIATVVSAYFVTRCHPAGRQRHAA